MKTLKELSRQPIEREDLQLLNEELHNGSDRASALIGAAMVESALTDALQARIFTTDSGDFAVLFNSENAPLSSFHSRIVMGKALAIYDNQIMAMLKIIKNIRNAFAHSAKPISFNHHLIQKEMAKFPKKFTDKYALHKLRKDMSTNSYSVREQYVQTCMCLAACFEMDCQKHGGKEMKFAMPDVAP